MSGRYVSAEAFEQAIWERDIALGQLAEIGKGLGANMDDVVEAMNYYKREIINEESKLYYL